MLGWLVVLIVLVFCVLLDFGWIVVRIVCWLGCRFLLYRGNVMVVICWDVGGFSVLGFWCWLGCCYLGLFWVGSRFWICCCWGCVLCLLWRVVWWFWFVVVGFGDECCSGLIGWWFVLGWMVCWGCWENWGLGIWLLKWWFGVGWDLFCCWGLLNGFCCLGLCGEGMLGCLCCLFVGCRWWCWCVCRILGLLLFFCCLLFRGLIWVLFFLGLWWLLGVEKVYFLILEYLNYLLWFI